MAESDQNRTEKQQDAFTFLSLVTTYQQIAWVALGKIANPASGKVERELEQARWAIDVLAMLDRRTRGNLSEAESRMLRDMLHVLRMNYVEEVNKPSEPAAQAPQAEPEPEKAPSGQASAGDAPAGSSAQPEGA